MSDTDPGPLLTVSGLTKRYGETTALDIDELAVPRGVTGLLGPNGAGKTTLLGLLLGLHPPSSGSLTVLGLDPAVAGPEVRARVGYGPEHRRVPADLRAVDFVRHMAEIHGLPSGDATARASDALWLVELGEERSRPLGTMSTGQLQRVKLAQAIAHDPAVIFLDEPTDGLDPLQRDAMLDLIRRVGDEFSISILLSSHLLAEVERVCDGVVILEAGRLLKVGSLADLRAAAPGLVVELTDREAVAALAATLRASGCEVGEDGLQLTVTGEGDLARHVQEALAASGASLNRLQPRATRLEDVFLETVG